MKAQELKNSILQLAIQGKLVEQRAEEGTATELIEQIKAEKERLITEKKIKKEKLLREITEDEIPFEIPESWEWVRLGDIANGIKAGGDKPKEFSEFKTEVHSVPVIANGIQNDGVVGYTDVATESEHCITVSGRGTIGFSCIRKAPFCPIVRLLVVRMPQILVDEYIKYVLEGMIERGVGTSIQQLTVPMLMPKLMPLPPLKEQKRIVDKIEELLPYMEQYDKAYSKLEIFNKKFPENMQKSILQYAVLGKLVEQRPEEGTAEELYQQIQAEKERLIKEGKIKKGKPLSEITEDEIPFEIPESWKWVRLGSLSELITKGSSPSWQGIQYVELGLLFVTSENVGSEEILLNNPKYLEERFNEIQERSILKKGDILTNIVGASIGRAAIYDREDNANINQAVCLIRLANKSLGRYIVKYLNSYIAYQIMMRDKVDTARANISLTNINNFIIPLPPLGEQKRIVQAIEEYLPYCQQLVK